MYSAILIYYICRKLKDLTETKLEYDKLKVDCDVEKRTFEMKLSNEAEQTKKYHGIFLQILCGIELYNK